MSVRLMIFLPTVLPLPHTNSAKSSGKVYSIVALYVLFAPVLFMPQLWKSISPVLPKNSPARKASMIGASFGYKAVPGSA